LFVETDISADVPSIVERSTGVGGVTKEAAKGSPARAISIFRPIKIITAKKRAATIDVLFFIIFLFYFLKKNFYYFIIPQKTILVSAGF
jgi:hypothetical protein